MVDQLKRHVCSVIFYDPVGRSIGGVAAKAFDHGTSCLSYRWSRMVIEVPLASDFLLRALEAVSSCDCLEGCENCELPDQFLR